MCTVNFEGIESIQNLYDTNFESWINHPRATVRSAYLRLLGDVNGKYILDAGCGCGIDCLELSKRGAIGYGIDVSAVSIEQSRKLFGDNSSWMFNCCYIMSFKPEVLFDVVLCSMVVMHHKNLSATLRNLSSFLKPGGQLLLVTNNPYLVCQDFHVEYPQDESVCYQHCFSDNGKMIQMTKYLHSISSYINGGLPELSVVYMQEIALYNDETKFFNPIPHPGTPNFISFLYRKNVVMGK